MQKIRIDVNLISKYPWIYIQSINGNIIPEKFNGNHGFTIALLSLQPNKMLMITDTNELFKLIRKYK